MIVRLMLLAAVIVALFRWPRRHCSQTFLSASPAKPASSAERLGRFLGELSYRPTTPKSSLRKALLAQVAEYDEITCVVVASLGRTD